MNASAARLRNVVVAVAGYRLLLLLQLVAAAAAALFRKLCVNMATPL